MVHNVPMNQWFERVQVFGPTAMDWFERLNRRIDPWQLSEWDRGVDGVIC